MWLIGGGAKSKIFGTDVCDITGLKVKVPKTNEITLVVVRSMLLSASIYKNHEQACISPEIKAEYKPDPKTACILSEKIRTFCKISGQPGNMSELSEMSFI